MTSVSETPPAITLVDDDFYSARLMMRMLAAHDRLVLQHVARPDELTDALTGSGAGPVNPNCGMVVVDLKSSSDATRDFVARLRQTAPSLLVVAMAPTLDRDTRTALLEAGAAAVFERHADVALYRREAASIIAFWARSQRLGAVGT